MNGGCTETDNNGADFTAVAPNPRNTASPLSPCSATEAAPTVATSLPVNGATDFPVGGNLTVTFSEPVDVTGDWFNLNCSSSGNVTAMVTGGPTVFTLDPSVTLVHQDSCTLTVLAAQVSDQDVLDPPDNMAANHTVGFSPYDVCAATYTPAYQIQGSGTAWRPRAM